MRAQQIAMATGGAAFMLVLGALGFQYIGHLAPCEMCLWQRWPHIAAAIFGLGGGLLVNAGFIDARHARALAWTAILLVAASGAIGAYQQGMILHWLPGPQACTVDHPYVLGSGDAPDVRCDALVPVLFGLSLAFYNALFSLGTAAVAAFCMRRKP